MAILLVSLASLLLEVGYTRIISFKLWYYYTYAVIGFALLGIGSGGVIVAVFSPFRRWATNRIIAACSIWGAISIAAGYLVVARLRLKTVAIWDYGTADSFSNFLRLAFICFTIFATFVAVGIIISVLLGRAGPSVNRIYFADLVGAGLGCILAIPLIVRLGPPRVIMLAALVFAGVGLAESTLKSFEFGLAAVASLLLLVALLSSSLLPDVRVEDGKVHAPVTEYSAWGPVFRVDVLQLPGQTDDRLLLHDGTFGSGIHRFDGNREALKSDYEKDARSVPFATLGSPPGRELIIGSAGGNEILASLAFGATNIEGVELNPVTTGLLTTNERFADFTGHLPDQPEVHITQGDGRSYLARSDTDYDLVWYVAPDSYAATNAASSGAFVLSESYLYTTEMIKQTLEHLTDNGVMVVQFGELNFRQRSNRTSRYVVSAREALNQLGVADPSQHILVAAEYGGPKLSTIIVKREAFTPEEVDRFIGQAQTLPDDPHVIAAPGRSYDEGIVSQLASGTNAEVAALVASAPNSIGAISDNAPYFWHFSNFRDVIANIGQPIKDGNDPENVIGERVLLLLLFIAVVYAALFLLVPFFAVRERWRALPAKGTSALFFASLGLGFMFFEITLIQRLVLFLGYPTYSLTVTLATILVATGLGALASRRFEDRTDRAMPVILGILAALTAFYMFVLPAILTGPLLETSLWVRILVTVVILTPLGLCLGMFMPLGITRVASLTDYREEYVAWAWAVNGFFSVIGSVLTTILSMALGFRVVQILAFLVYCVAVFAFTRLPSARKSAGADISVEEPTAALP